MWAFTAMAASTRRLKLSGHTAPLIGQSAPRRCASPPCFGRDFGYIEDRELPETFWMTMTAFHPHVFSFEGKLAHRVVVKFEVSAFKTCLLVALFASDFTKLTIMTVCMAGLA